MDLVFMYHIKQCLPCQHSHLFFCTTSAIWSDNPFFFPFFFDILHHHIGPKKHAQMFFISVILLYLYLQKLAWSLEKALPSWQLHCSIGFSFYAASCWNNHMIWSRGHDWGLKICKSKNLCNSWLEILTSPVSYLECVA